MSAGKMAATASEKKPPEPPRFYVLYGNREAEINEAKLEIARRLIPNEADRRENIVEIAPPGNRPTLALRDVYSDVVAELGQSSLFGETCRLVIVRQLQEFFHEGRGGAKGGRGRKGGGKKSAKSAKSPGAGASPGGPETTADPVEAFLLSTGELLATTKNALILIAVEDDAKNRRVNDKGSFFEAVSKKGKATVLRFTSKALRFELSDALLSRSLSGAVAALAAWRREDRAAAPAIFRVLTEDLQGLIQALVYVRDRDRIEGDPVWRERLFPSELRPNLLTLHDFRRQKYLNATRNYPTFGPLLEALHGLVAIQRALYPTGDELYVPDVNYLIDVWVARLLSD